MYGGEKYGGISTELDFLIREGVGHALCAWLLLEIRVLLVSGGKQKLASSWQGLDLE